MKEISHECYVSLEVAKLLKEAGFDWLCNHAICCDSTHYPNLKEGDILEYNYLECSELMEGKKPHMLLCPTLEVAQRWLREVGNKNGTVILTLNFNENISKHWEVKGIHLNKDRTVMHWFYTCHVKPYGRGIIPVDCWDTYEDAQEAGIKKALEIILEKGE